MKSRQPELRGIPQFDCWTVEIAFGARAASTEKQSNKEHNCYEIEPTIRKRILYLLASNFNQTLSFNDSGHVCGTYSGIREFEEKVGYAWLNRTSPTGWP